MRNPVLFLKTLQQLAILLVLCSSAAVARVDEARAIARLSRSRLIKALGGGWEGEVQP